MSDTSLQERYAPNNACFGCGPANAAGLRLKSFVDGDDVVCTWQPDEIHQAFPGVLSGGIVGTLPVPVREVSSTLGRPDVNIVDSAREAKAGLIVMGAYGRNRITDLFLGSNAAAVARTSPVAVLLAR